MTPSPFQVYTKIDEESRKDNKLQISFLLTLNDTRGVVTYEFRGVCIVTGTAADFEAIMETSKNSRVPKILDVLYQKLYPGMFMLAGMTSSAFPQSVALLTDMVTTEPIAVKQEAIAITTDGQETKVEASAKPKQVSKPTAPKPAAPKATPVMEKPAIPKPKVETEKPTA